MKNAAKSMNRNLKIVLAVVAVIALVAFAGGWFYILNISSESNRLDTEARNLLMESSTLSDLKLSLARIALQKEAVYEAIPRTKEVSAFLRDFESLARYDGMIVSSMTVGDVKTKAKVSSDFSQTISKNEYYELPITYQMGGDYTSLTKLVADIDNQKRLMSVTNLVVSADSEGKTVLGKVKATFILTVNARK